MNAKIPEGSAACSGGVDWEFAYKKSEAALQSACEEREREQQEGRCD